jgi:lipoyl(octanoyl) transferase
MSLKIQNWGLIDYSEALTRQEVLVQQIYKNQEPGEIIFCSHPPIITRGRKTQKGDIFDWSGPILDVKRGGRATYHGPSQLVIYPIINLNFRPSPHPRQDVLWLIRSLEFALIQTLLVHYGLKARGKTQDQNSNLDDTGVWISEKKIASIGIGVSQWVSYHGMAVNAHHDPNAFKGLLPCGYQSNIMTSLERETDQPIDKTLLARQIEGYLLELLDQ